MAQIPVDDVFATPPTADDPAFTVVVPPGLDDFSDDPADPRWHAVEVKGMNALDYGGSFSIQAEFQIDNLDRPAWHYLFAHNKQDEGKEIFLRVREQDGDWYYQFGTWQNGKNYMVSVPIPDDDRPHGGIPGAWTTLLGVYDVVDNRIRLCRNGAVWYDAEGAPDIGAFLGEHLIGAHDTLTVDPEVRVWDGKAHIFKVSAPLPSMIFYSDNDNNGYIHSDEKNPEGADRERNIRPCERRLTYFDEEKCKINNVPVAVPADYRRVYLRIQPQAAVDALKIWQYKFVVEGGDGILTVQRNQNKANPPVWGAVPADWRDIVSDPAQGDDLLFSAPQTDKTYTDYYIAETVTATGKTVPAKPVKVKLMMRTKPTAAVPNPAEITGKVVEFRIQEAQAPNGHYEWIVPSGWKIEGNDENWTLTTMVPTKGAVPPMKEGSAYDSSADGKNGCVFSTQTWHEAAKGGCEIEIIFDFVGNTYDPVKSPSGADPSDAGTGFLQIDQDKDKNGDEKILPDDQRKLSFVGNSGIKFGGWRGTGDGYREVAIFNTKAMVDRVSITAKDDDDPNKDKTYTGLPAFKYRQETGKDRTGVPNVLNAPNTRNDKVRFGADYITQDMDSCFEELFRLLHGIGYNQYTGKTADVKILRDFDTAAGTTVADRLHSTLSKNYDRVSAVGNKMKIRWERTGSAGGLTTGTLTVWLNDETSIFYKEENVKFHNGTTYDGRIYIQSHWGSGVKFTKLTIKPLINTHQSERGAE